MASVDEIEKSSLVLCVLIQAQDMFISGGGGFTRQPSVHLVSLRHKLSGRLVTGSIAHYLVTGNLDKSRSMSVIFFSPASQPSGILHS